MELEYDSLNKTNNQILIKNSTISIIFQRLTCAACQMKRDSSGVEYVCIEFDELEESCKIDNEIMFSDNFICNNNEDMCCCKVDNFNDF